MNTAKADQFLSQTATLLRRRQAKIDRLDGNLVEQDIAARREDALIGCEFAKQVDQIEAALKTIGSNLNVDQWCKQNCGVNIRTMRRRKRLYRNWKEYETKRRELGECGQVGVPFGLSLIQGQSAAIAMTGQEVSGTVGNQNETSTDLRHLSLPVHYWQCTDRASETASSVGECRRDKSTLLAK